MDNNKLNQMISELLESMEFYNVGLFIGQGIKMEELPQSILSLNWRFVVTSQRNENFPEFFYSDKRDIHVYTLSDKKEIQNIVFSSIHIPIVQLFDSEDLNDGKESQVAKYKINTKVSDIMGIIADKLDVRSKLVIIGYDPSNDDELSFQIFYSRWDQIRGARVFFFDGGKENDYTVQIEEIAEERNDYWCELSLADALAAVDFDDESVFETEINFAKQLFYKGNKATFIENKMLLKCQNFAQLLTDESVNETRPMGKAEKERYFELFLDNSSIRPQWYGYDPELDYYLERPFEETLYKLIQIFLNGKEKELPDIPGNKKLPIILEGDPGTSKSITLGAIAFKIFKNRKNPVVFIKNEELSFKNDECREFQLLDQLLREIENAPGADERVLIIWDTAAYRNVEDIAGNLSRMLDNLGRRFVLVCTAYRGASREDVNYNPRTEKKSNIKSILRLGTEGTFKKVEEKDNSGKCVYNDGRALFVATTRDLSETDRNILSEKIRKYTDLDEPEESDIFEYYFQLRYELRERLADGLSVEQRIIGCYVKNQLRVMTNNRVKEDKTLNPMVKAMIKAGIISEEEAISRFKEDEEKELEDNSNYDLDSFNISIALFSRYKLKMPYRLAFSMLFAQSNGSSDDLYKNTQLLDFITTSIPWLYYGTDAQDRFIFSFRSSREADIFLWRKDVNEESQINYLIRMFDVYYNEYYEDEEIKNAVISLARMMGPNSEYYTEFENDKHRLILQNLDKVIDKLATMRSLNNSHNFDVSLAQIEITFTREYYGKLWGKILGKTDEESEGEAKPRLKKLKEALELAQTCIEKLRREKDTADSSKKKYTQEQINRFAYEIAYCKIAMEELSESEVSAADDKELDVQTPEYFQIYPLLVEAVNSDPVNGFSYNAMFKLFEHEYAKTNDKDDIHKLTVLSEVRGYVEEAKTLDIVNRGMNGRDEVLENIVKIEAMAVDYPVDIDTIENGGDTDFVEVFNQCLAKNKACAIVFVCQQELNKYGLLHFNENDETVKTELTEEQVEICRKVYKFISKDEYKSCVERDAFAMYLKLQVAWLLFNRRPLNIGDKEAQLTYIRNKEQWKQIRNICETCINCKDGIKKPIVYLIFALSIVQTTGGYLEAYNKAIAKIEEKAPFTSQARMRVPYIICENPGEPRKYYGTLYNVDNRKSGYLRVTGIPMEMGKKRGVRVGANNIGERFLPEKNSPIPDLEIGIGYTGFSAYTEAGRKNRGDM